jgi:hypothetical protein
MQLTITEALQEIKTIGNRLLKKRESIVGYIGRDARLRDPFEDKGGSEKFIREERQSIGDLEKRLISIRVAIQKANLEKRITVENVDQTVSEWLTWRRELSNPQKMFLNGLYKTIQTIRKEVNSKGGKIVAQAASVVNYDPQTPAEFIMSVDEMALINEIEQFEKILGTLDGKLSLFNAITIIDIP